MSVAVASGPDAFSQGVVQCLSPAILRRAADDDVGLAIWRRPARVALRLPSEALLAMPPSCRVTAGTPAAATRALMRELPFPARPRGGDIETLAAMFAGLAGEAEIRLRLEHVDDDACRCHHVDSVGLRLLCTYAGPGTEWLDPGGHAHRMPLMHVGVFKGTRFPDAAPRVLHRSPPVSHLPPGKRSRILLCIDQPGVF
jgi:hypothetical protein